MKYASLNRRGKDAYADVKHEENLPKQNFNTWHFLSYNNLAFFEFLD
ncbi:hypothetical protein HC174_02555 [Salinimicrobium sp. CDJ15-81-2]|nr:hypothetical protein [Salinimicrobium nanhaiense]